MDAVDLTTAFRRQRRAFYFALANFLGLVAWGSVRIYFVFLGDSYGDRQFALNPSIIGSLPFWVLSWIIAFVIVSNSILESKRVTWYGIGTLAMLAVPAVPVAMMVFISFWGFTVNP